jgi:excisionase family DNA binding protein
MQNTEDLLSTRQAADILGVSTRRVVQLADAGKLPFVRTSIGRLFSRDGLDARLAEREAADSPGAA